MADDTLPPGTTHDDIDENFGDIGGVEITGVVVMEVKTKVLWDPTEKEKRGAIIAQASKGNFESMEVQDVQSRRFEP